MKVFNIPVFQWLALMVCVASPIVAFKILGSAEGAAASMAAGMLLNFLLGRGEPPDPPASPPSGGASAKVIGFMGAAAMLCLAACMGPVTAIDDPELAAIGVKLSKCRSEARGAYQVGASAEEAMSAYEACKKREGL